MAQEGWQADVQADCAPKTKYAGLHGFGARDDKAESRAAVIPGMI
jgi:hypothetical protein